MKKLWSMIQYYYCWQPSIKYLALAGAFLLLLEIPMAFINDMATLVLGICTFAFLILIPFCSGTSALRVLISSNQLGLVPGFRLQAGIAHLLLALAASCFLYINWILFSGVPTSLLLILRTFICLSLFAGFMQLILPSRFFVLCLSILPLIIAMLVIRFKELASVVFLDPAVSVALFLASLAGWAYGLWVLKTRGAFKPANQMLYDTEAWATYDGGFLTRQSIGKPRTAVGTLLLGYPDSWSGIIFRVTYYFLITPMFTTGVLYMIGFGEKWNRPVLETIGSMFLLFSLFSAVFCVFIYGELVARARLVWLRYGTDRGAQWRLVENHCFKFLLVYYLCAVLTSATALMLFDLPTQYVMHYLIIVVSYCYFNLFLALMLRVNNFHGIVIVLYLISSMAALMFGIFKAMNEIAPDPRVLFGVEILLVILGSAFRSITRKKFMQIDWKEITLNTPGGRAYFMTGFRGDKYPR